MPIIETPEGILPWWGRLVLFFIFLILIATETYFVLHIEQQLAERNEKYPKRIHPKEVDDKK